MTKTEKLSTIYECFVAHLLSVGSWQMMGRDNRHSGKRIGVIQKPNPNQLPIPTDRELFLGL